MQQPNTPAAILAAVEALERPLSGMSEAEWQAELARVAAAAPAAAMAAMREARRHPVNCRTTRRGTAQLRAIVARLGAARQRVAAREGAALARNGIGKATARRIAAAAAGMEANGAGVTASRLEDALEAARQPASRASIYRWLRLNLLRQK